MGKSKKAFTLIELIVVVAVLALLAAVAVPMISGWVEKAEENAALTNARTIELALKAYMAEEGLDRLNVLDPSLADAVTALDKYGIGTKESSPSSFYTGYYIEGSKMDYFYNSKGEVKTSDKKGAGLGYGKIIANAKASGGDDFGSISEEDEIIIIPEPPRPPRP